MNIRPLAESDLPTLRLLHEEFYADEFKLEEMFRNYVELYAVTTDEGQLVSAGGFRAIAESVLITNKRCSVRKRREALITILEASKIRLKEHGFDQLHAFIQDDVWLEHLEKVGFTPTKGKALLLCL